MLNKIHCVFGIILCILSNSAVQSNDRSIMIAADPDAREFDGYTYIYPTTVGIGGEEFKSYKIQNNKVVSSSVVLHKKDISWANDGRKYAFMWGPTMVLEDGKYFFYFAVGPQWSHLSKIGVATCDGPSGPCRDSGAPLIVGEFGKWEAIDPCYIKDKKTGERYILAGGSTGSKINAFRLNADMVSVAEQVEIKQPEKFTEGCDLFERDGIYHLTYSSGNWMDSTYGIAYSVSRSPLGPWKFVGYLAQTDWRYKGPGGQSIYQSKNGKYYISYHRWEGKTTDGPYPYDDRKVVIREITFNDKGILLPILNKKR